MPDPDSGLRFEEGDILQSQSRLWRVTNKRVEVTLLLTEVDSLSPQTPVQRVIEGEPDNIVFGRSLLRRLIPEGEELEPR
jgi:hypothetical protein